MTCIPGCVCATDHPYECETDLRFACASCGVSLRFHDAEHGSCDDPKPKKGTHWLSKGDEPPGRCNWVIAINDDFTEAGITSRENWDGHAILRHDTNDKPLTVMVEVKDSSWNEAMVVYETFLAQRAAE